MIGKRLPLYIGLAAALAGCGGATANGGSFGQALVLLNGSQIQRMRLSNGDFIGNAIPLNKTIVAITYNPDTGILYGFGSDTRLYTIHPFTGVCSTIGDGQPTNWTPSNIGLSVDPATGKLRYVNAEGGNVIFSVLTGQLDDNGQPFEFEVGDPNQGDNPDLVGCAFRPASSAVYALDSNNDLLVRAPAPNSGQLETVGTTGVDFSGNSGFAIDSSTGFGYVVSDGTNKGFFRVDLDTGHATAISTANEIEDLTILH